MKKIGFQPKMSSKSAITDEKTDELKDSTLDSALESLAEDLIDIFCEKYLPASGSEITHRFTTTEIYKSITSFAHNKKLSAKKLTIDLIARGYKYELCSDCDILTYKWTLREKL